MYGCDFSQPLSYGGFEFAAYLSMFTFNFIKNCNIESDVGYKLMVHYLVYLEKLHWLFLAKNRVIKRVTKLVCTFYE